MKKLCINDRILILCSGLSHYFYAKALVRGLPDVMQQAIAVIQCHHSIACPRLLLVEALRRVNQARRERNPFDEVWLFFDMGNNAEDAKATKEMQEKGLCLAYTLVCFEYWVLLHFEDCQQFLSSDDGLKEVKRLWPEYDKRKAGVFNDLQDNMQAAIQRVTRGGSDLKYIKYPLFTVYKLIEFIETLKQRK